MKRLAFFISLILFFGSCNGIFDNSENGEITEIFAPDTLILNQPANIDVYFSGGTNGCYSASHLEINKTSNSVIVKAFYNYPSGFGLCPMVIPEHVLSFTLVADKIGELIIQADDSGGLTDTIQVVSD